MPMESWNKNKTTFESWIYFALVYAFCASATQANTQETRTKHAMHDRIMLIMQYVWPTNMRMRHARGPPPASPKQLPV